MKIIFALLIGYAFGCLNGSYICGKIKGVDFKKVGSKNAGASNVGYSLGIKYAIVVGLLDIGKAIAAYYLCIKLFGDVFYGQLAGAASIIGHNHPFYMGFNGGKGFASLAGLIIAYDYKIALVLLPIYIIVVFVSKHMSVGSFSIMLASLIIPWLYQDYKFAIIMIVVFIDMMFRHIPNIKNLIAGTESKITEAKR